MAPQHDALGRHNSDNVSQSRQSTRNTEAMARSAGLPQRLRNDESWVEISSQPSSSSQSSVGEEIVTTGLRVQHDLNARLARRRLQRGASHMELATRQASTSSQEEYDESESEEDRVMSSSNENFSPSTRLSTVSQPVYNAGSGSDNDDENATALGIQTEPAFTPQPNAFSHPPSSQRPMVPGSYFPRTSHPSAPTRPSYNNRSRSQHTSYNQVDHDAALRASLTTLLSIGAAAARGLPKREQGSQAMTSNEPMNLRFVPESELMGTIPPPASHPSPSTRARSSPSISSQEATAALEKGKRKPAAGEKARIAKKKKVQLVEQALVSPTLLTWAMSAGVVVLVSVVGFGAGYVIGREAGRQEVLAGLNGSSVLGDGTSCGGEVARSSGTLRRFKWGSGVVAKSVVA